MADGDGGNGTKILVAAIAGAATIAAALIASGKLDHPGAKPDPAPTTTASASPTPTPSAVATAVPSTVASASPVPTPSASPAEVADIGAKDADIDGDWRGLDGSEVAITQSGQQVDLQQPVMTPYGPVTYVGRGRVEGHAAMWDFTSPINDGGRCSVTVARRGNRMQGTCQHNSGQMTGVSLSRE